MAEHARRPPQRPRNRRVAAAREARTARTPGNAPARTRRAPSAAGGRAHRSSQARRSEAGRASASYRTPSLWTKDAPRSRRAGSRTASPRPSIGGALARAAAAAGRALLALLGLAARGLAFIGRSWLSLVRRSRAALAASAVVALVVVGGAVDFGMNAGKAYPGVRVGDIDVSGKTSDEIVRLIDEAYASRLAGASATIYASDEAASRTADAASAAEDAALAEQIAVEEARASKEAWTASAADLGAAVPSEDLAREALAVGREDGGILSRLGSLFAGTEIEVRAAYDGESLEALASDIDATIGEPRIDYGIAVVDGTAQVTEGSDGALVDRDVLRASLDDAFLSGDSASASFAARAEYAPVRIDAAASLEAAEAVNRALSRGAQFDYHGSTWVASDSDLGAWVTTSVEERDGGWKLIPAIDETAAKPALLAAVEERDTGAAPRITIDAEAGGAQATIHTDGTGSIPLVAEAVRALDEALFSGEGAADAEGAPVISIAVRDMPEQLSFDEALDLGVVGAIASYTTEFTTGAGTENRNHNIALVSQLLSNSVAKAGETWSYNATAGECNEERGFLGAGAIVNGEYQDAVGGGICQVATTVFNAVYESGLPVVTRHNHSLYIASYPQGRDAAVSWPDLDLVWENDTESDVLVRLSCEDGQVTTTLYGVDPGYTVSTETGAWGKGEEHATRTQTDESLAPGTSYVKTRGSDGSTIEVVRTVKDAAGTVVRRDLFASVYDPITEVVVQGPDAPDASDGSS